VNTVSFGKASWIGLIGAIAAAIAPFFTDLPGTTGAIISGILAAITVIGRQAQAITNTKYGASDEPLDLTTVVSEAPAVATDAA
jgi:hypothetical protein